MAEGDNLASVVTAGDPTPCNPHVVQLKLVLIMTMSHFETPGLLDERRTDHALDSGRQSLLSSQKSADVRLALGLSHDIWVGLTGVFTHAIYSLARQSFTTRDDIAPGYPGTSSALSSTNFVALLKDIERVNDLCLVARNMLATTSEAQDLAAEVRLDQLVLKLIDVCVRVTARGYDGEAGSRSEERWQRAINAYKKLLVTCLQFLHNLLLNNERRKLLLWMDLFGNSPCADPSFMARVNPAAYFQPAALPDHASPENAMENIAGEGRQGPTAISREPRSESGTLGFRTSGGAPLALENDHALRVKLMSINRTMSELALVNTQAASKMEQNPSESEATAKRNEGSDSAPASHPDSDTTTNLKDKGSPSPARSASANLADPGQFSRGSFDVPAVLSDRPVVSPLLIASNFTGLQGSDDPDAEDDTTMFIGPDSAAQILSLAKDQLLDRINEHAGMPIEQGLAPTTENVGQAVRHQPTDLSGEDLGSKAAANGSVEDDDESYSGPGDQERGLLTDIPLVLGPNEIEALPMIIQTGIVDAFATKSPDGIKSNMQAIRCNILIAQESGRNLLRELLIFVAAWDLADDEIYFKMMMQIVEAMLVNGLLPCTYEWFAESKDIISPAQAVMIKLLTQIFRAKQTQPQPATSASNPGASSEAGPPSASRVDILVVRYIFGQFRVTVVPETCALIYLQGQIRAGKIEPEDFPLNLWDMERVYEGVYQYLEFFAVLTEAEEWKHLLVEWEITHELIALLRELHAGIPSGPLSAHPVSSGAPVDTTPSASTAQPRQHAPMAVERPYDPSPTSPGGGDGPSAPSSPPAVAAGAADSPEAFEWRNLKKLVVLVLSSLVWKAGAVQDQVRLHGGVEAVLQCCNFDGHNPYIREHAIMCLRFLLEGNPANMHAVGQLQPRAAVPSEVLDHNGFETFIDPAGKVGLRMKPADAAAVPSSSKS